MKRPPRQILIQGGREGGRWKFLDIIPVRASRPGSGGQSENSLGGVFFYQFKNNPSEDFPIQ